MKVSIIIPVYNMEKYLDECLESVVNQTLKNIEIICINDGSTDKSLDILRKYEKKYSNIMVINQENLGVGNARNVGLKLAKGEYIFFLDSDDYIEFDALERCYAEAKQHKLDVVLLDSKKLCEIKTDEWKIYDFIELNRYYEFGNKIMSGEEAFNLMIEKKVDGWWTCCLHVFRNDFIKDIDIKFNEEIMHEDIIYIAEVILKSKRVKHIGAMLYNCRVRLNSRQYSSNIEKYADSHYICGEILKEKFCKYEFNYSKTRVNLNKYIIYLYKRSILDCDKVLSLKKRVEICNNIDSNIKDIKLSMQIEAPILSYKMKLKEILSY